MRLLLTLLFVGTAFAQAVLPPVNTITINATTCTFSVADPQMSLAAECVLNDGTILSRSVAVPNIKGTLLGTGPIECLLWTDGAANPTVSLQCTGDDDLSGPKLVLNGKLAPVAKKRQWWIFWR